MAKLLSKLHRWLGFPLGLLFVVTFGTGCLTAIDELLERFQHARFNSHYVYQETTSAEMALAITTITEGKNGIGSITLPTANTPYYRVGSRGESWTYAINDLSKASYEKSDNEGFFRTVLQLHRNFLLGKEGLFSVDGKYYAAWVGLAALFLSLLGLWIWWPLRKSFSVKEVVPQGKKRKNFYFSHMTSGVITLVAIVLLSLTGASITYRSVAQKIFGVEPNVSANIETQKLEHNWQAWIDGAYAQMPEGSVLTQIRFPRGPRGNSDEKKDQKAELKTSQRTEKTEKPRQRNKNEIEPANPKMEELDFRFSTPGDWFSLARSSVKIDKQSSTLLTAQHFKQLPLNEKIYSILVPLHTGHDLPLAYVLLLLVFGLMGTSMVFSGLLSFVMKKRRWPKYSQREVLVSAAD